MKAKDLIGKRVRLTSPTPFFYLGDVVMIVGFRPNDTSTLVIQGEGQKTDLLNAETEVEEVSE